MCMMGGGGAGGVSGTNNYHADAAALSQVSPDKKKTKVGDMGAKEVGWTTVLGSSVNKAPIGASSFLG